VVKIKIKRLLFRSEFLLSIFLGGTATVAVVVAVVVVVVVAAVVVVVVIEAALTESTFISFQI
jgi:hypothetical protein